MLNKLQDQLIFVFIALFVFISFLLFMYFSTFNHISKDTAVWGAFGDYIGGLLNPVFAFLSFMALLITLIFQNKQLQQNQQILQETIKAIEQNEKALSQNQKALEFNRIELENSNKQLELSAKAQTEIEKTQKIQQFDTLFTTILSELNLINSNFLEKNLISDFYKVFYENFKLEFKQVNLRKKYALTKYFILLYQIFKLVVENKFLSYYDQKKYINIVRATIDNSILQLLMLNCNCEGFSDDFDEYYDFIEEFGILEHMDFQNTENPQSEVNADLLLCLKNYSQKCFGKNIYLQGVNEIWYFEIIKKRNIKSKFQFFMYLLFSRKLILRNNKYGLDSSLNLNTGNNTRIQLVIDTSSYHNNIIIDFDLTKFKLRFSEVSVAGFINNDDLEFFISIKKDTTIARVKFKDSGKYINIISEHTESTNGIITLNLKCN